MCSARTAETRRSAMFIEPLYERFDGYRPSIDLVANQMSELKRQPGFGARGG
jgi:hypothetical protein